MKLPLAYYGDPILRKKCTPVDEITDEVRELVENMIETVIDHNGLGIAAPQVKEDRRIFITNVPIEQPDGNWEKGELFVFINPEILSISDEMDYYSEGCLSIPKLYADVLRPIAITIQAMDIDGNIFEKEFTGLQARACLHENDHINGVLYIDRLDRRERKRFEKALREIKKKYSK